MGGPSPASAVARGRVTGDAFYREVARIALAVAEKHGFVLGGGVAWLVNGLVRRPTEDIDLFTDTAGGVVAAAGEVTAALTAAGYRVVVTGGPTEVELTSAVAGPSAALDLGGRTRLDELAAVLASASVVVVGNTGPAHLAAAVGTPVVSLFAPTVPAERWAPYRVPCVLLGDQHAVCRDTRVTRCPFPGHPCLTSVTPTDAFRAVEAMTGRDRRPAAGRRETA